jgi:nucleoside-diphosphate-sugar epimerase
VTNRPIVDCKIIIPGGAGLVGQNLIARLREKGCKNLVVLDKHTENLRILREIFPEVSAYYADLAKPGEWVNHFENSDVVVMLQAQIGGTDYEEFVRNNVTATKLILEQVKEKQVPRLVHISSSVVESVADDFYTQSKTEQEQLVLSSGIECPILRPTLMFGWFDRKHLGWLSRFMKKAPVFPVPGNGRFMRQPLYVGDFCEVIVSCIENPDISGVFNISGHEKVDYIDIIREIKSSTNSKTPILKIPYSIFYALLWLWSLFDKNPPFTTQQLQALITKDEFEVIDWPGIFGVNRTSFKDAVDETFNDPTFSNVILEF